MQPDQSPTGKPDMSSIEFSPDDKERGTSDAESPDIISDGGGGTWRVRKQFYNKCRPFILWALASLILAWWISATVLKSTRHRWYVSLFWSVWKGLGTEDADILKPAVWTIPLG